MRASVHFAVITLAFIIPAIWYFFDNSIAYGQEDNQTETTTYLDCYNGLQGQLLLFSAFSPPEVSSLVGKAMLDQELKQWFSDKCNFYHEKTGMWFTMNPFDEDWKMYRDMFENEFFQKYPIPEIAKQINDKLEELKNK